MPREGEQTNQAKTPVLTHQTTLCCFSLSEFTTVVLGLDTGTGTNV